MLGWLGAVGALSLLPSWRGAESASRGFALRLVQTLQLPPASARSIGSAYLLVAPNEACIDRLAECITDAASVTAEEGDRLTPDALVRLFRHQTRADFESGNVVSIAGWVLSRTEARLCGLITLASV